MKKTARKKIRNSELRVKKKLLGFSWKNLLQFFFMIPVVILCIIESSQLLISRAEAATGINRTINFQGKVVNKTGGTNVSDGNYTFIFKIYDSASAGTKLWGDETQTNVPVTNGIFQVALGSVRSFATDSLDFNQDNLWLDITFNGETFGSRIRLSAVPYALTAEKVAGLTVTNNGGNTLNIAANKTLTVNNSLTLSGADSKTLSIGSNSLTFSTSADTTLTLPSSGTLATLAGSENFTNKTYNGLSITGSDPVIMSPTSSGALTVQSNGAKALTLDTGGAAAVTIGASANAITIGNNTAANNTAVTLTTGGSGVITLGSNTGTGNVVVQPNAGGQAALMVVDNGVGDLLTASAGATTKFRITNSGNLVLNNNQELDFLDTNGAVRTILSLNSSGNTFLRAGNATGRLDLRTQANNNVFSIDQNGKIGVGSFTSTSSPLANVDIRATFGHIPVASVSGTTSAASFLLDQSGTGDIFTASASGATRFTLGKDGNITATSNSNSAFVLGANGATNPVFQVDSSTGSVATGLKITGGATGGTTALTAIDSGSNSSLSIDAKGSGTVTINGTATGGITLGHATTITTGGLTVTSGDVAITAGNLTLGGTTRLTNAGVGTFQSGTTIANTGSPDYLDLLYTGGNGGEYRFYVNTGNGITNDFAITDGNANSKFYLAGNSQTSAGIPPDAVGIGPGFITPHAALDVESGSKAGNAVLILNQLGAGVGNDLLSASASGTTKFTVNSSGSVSIAASQSYTGVGAVTLSSGGSSGLTLDSASGRVSVATGDFLNTGVSGVSGAAAGDIWYDTAANKFEINENGATKILCNTTDAGCGTGGAVTLQSAYNGGQVIDFTGVSSTAGLTIGTANGTGNILFQPNAGGAAAVVINKQGSVGDIFTASASGTTKFVISNSGNVGIGSNAPQEELTLGPTANLVGEMAIPTGTSATVQAGGTLPNATYFYVVTASDGLGETIKSTETSGCTSTNAGGGQHTCLVSWTSVVGAVSYKIYRTTSSGTYTGSAFLTSVAATSYSDTGAVSLTAGTPPAATTAYVTKFTYSGNSWLIGDNFGLGTTSPLSTLHVKGGKSGGNAAAIFDQVGASTNDILAASASGTTKFIVHNDGSIQTNGGNGTADITSITAGAGLTILPKANTGGAGGTLVLKGGNGSTTAGGVTIDSGTGTSPTVTIGGTNATTITFGGSQNPNFTFSGSGTFQTSSGTNTLGGATNISGALTVTAASTNAIAVGRQGATSPALQVDSSTNATSVTGLKIVAGGAGGGLALSEIGGNTNENLTFDAKGSGTVTIAGTSTGAITLGRATGISGALTITSNGTTALTVGASGAINPVLQVDASTTSVATGLKVLGAATGGTTAVSVIDSGSNANLSVDAKGSGTVTIGGTSTGNIIIGGSANGLTFSTSTGPAYAGTGRPTKQIILSAEYPGAVLTASNSANISGSMTSDASPSALPTSFDWQNYYMWSATSNTSPTLQDYTVAVRVTLPKDFSAWATGNCFTVAFNTPFTSSTLNALDVYIYKDGDTAGIPVAFRTGQVSGTSKNWTTVNFTSSDFAGTKTWNSAGGVAVIYLKMRSANTPNYVQVGDITLNYLAAF